MHHLDCDFKLSQSSLSSSNVSCHFVYLVNFEYIIFSFFFHFVQRVPDKFVSKFKDELSVAVALTVPDGHVWRVGLRKADNNKIWFQDCWQEFVDRYSIRIGYLLIFRYEGNSAFSVYIYNLSHSEINYHSTGLMDSAHNHFKRARLFEDLEDEDVEVVHPSSLYPSQHPETTAHANKGHTSSAIQSFFAEPPVKGDFFFIFLVYCDHTCN